jgi:hypothetical protein
MFPIRLISVAFLSDSEIWCTKKDLVLDDCGWSCEQKKANLSICPFDKIIGC